MQAQRMELHTIKSRIQNAAEGTKKTRKNTYARGENAIKHALQYC